MVQWTWKYYQHLLSNIFHIFDNILYGNEDLHVKQYNVIKQSHGTILVFYSNDLTLGILALLTSWCRAGLLGLGSEVVSVL